MTELRIDNVRNVYSNLGVLRSPGRDNNGNPQPMKFSGSFILTPDNAAIAKVEAITKSLLTERYGADAQARFKEIKASNCLLIHSGDEKATRPEYEGNFFFSASAWPDNPPKFFHRIPKVDGKDNLMSPAEIGLLLYGGSFVNVKVDIYIPKDKPNVSRRICAQLVAVQAFRDGDRFSNFAVSTGDDWDDVSTGEEKAAASTGGAW